MADINKVIVIGNLTRDVESKTTNNGKQTSKLSIACNGFSKEDVSYFDVITWESTAKFCADYLKKGMKVAVEGRLQQRNYVNKEGIKVYLIEIIANQVQNLTPRQDGNQNQGSFEQGQNPWGNS